MRSVREVIAATVVLAFVIAGVLTYASRSNHPVHGQAAGTVTITGPLPGAVSFFDMNGNPLVSYACVFVAGNSLTNGTFSFTFTPAPMWTTPANVWVQSVSIISPGSAPNQTYTPYITSVSSTGVAGNVKSGTTLAVLGATIISGTTAAKMGIEVCGY